MKSLGAVIVHMEGGDFNDTIDYKSLKLFLPDDAIKMNQHDHRKQCGRVILSPEWNKDVEVGDTIWFHHHITTGHINRLSFGKNQRDNHFNVDKEKGWYHIPYAEDVRAGYDSLAYASKKPDGTIIGLNDFLFGVGINEDGDDVTDGGLIVPKQRERGSDLEAKVKYTNRLLKEMGVEEGDTVGLTNFSDYKMNIDGEEVWRFRNKNIAYKRVGDDFIPVGDFAMVEMDSPDKETASGLYIPETAREEKNTGRILHGGGVHKEGDRVVMLSAGGAINLYENVFLQRTRSLIPQDFVESIEAWQQKD